MPLQADYGRKGRTKIWNAKIFEAMEYKIIEKQQSTEEMYNQDLKFMIDWLYSEAKTKKVSKRSLNLSHKERVVTKGDLPGASVSKPNAKVQKND